MSNVSVKTQGLDYPTAMGRLLVLYTQVDRLIMEICAERVNRAPDRAAELSLAKQVGDESRHVTIQEHWMRRFGTDPAPVISPEQEVRIREHFRQLPWAEFLVDLYLCVEALGSEAVEQVVPLADPGTRESLRIPLEDELDHVRFGVERLKQELAAMSDDARARFVAAIPQRLDALSAAFQGFGIEVSALFAAVGVDYDAVRRVLRARREALLNDLAA